MNDYFKLDHVEQGIWAAIAIPGSGALGNAAIIDLGDGVLVVDTFCLPQAAELLRQAAEELTGKWVKYIVNTHFHGDHHYGNQVFKDSTIISTGGTRDRLSELKPTDSEEWQLGLKGQIEAFRGILAVQHDQRVIKALGEEISDKENLYTAIPNVRFVLASITFSDRMVIHGSTRTAEVFTFGGGHTKSDALVYVPDQKVLIAGDLVLGKSHPAMLHGDPPSWLDILNRLQKELEIAFVIPGHGDVTDKASLKEMKDYLTDIQIYAKQGAQSGESIDAWLEKGIPEPYDEWKLPHVYEWNLRWLFNSLQQQSELHKKGQ
ncbi:MAG: MBL fold metallo-hydrolase [Gorillibacterium sp.]|nr:MBL fold metallo-hydrolase [Gorillibacterium sp.]